MASIEHAENPSSSAFKLSPSPTRARSSSIPTISKVNNYFVSYQNHRQHDSSSRVSPTYSTSSSSSHSQSPTLASSSSSNHLNAESAVFIPSMLVPTPSNSVQWLKKIAEKKSLPAARPNLYFEQDLFDPMEVPAAKPSLKVEAWEQLLANYPDQEAVRQVVGAIRHGALLGYEGNFEVEGRRRTRNLPMTKEEQAHVDMEVADRLRSGRIKVLTAESNAVLSPIGTVPKPNSSKLRTIHHLSYPRKGNSVNAGIRSSFVAIKYEYLDKMANFVRDKKGSDLWKVDLKEAFRSVGLASSQSRLLGFSWRGVTYGECALSFGGKSSPWIFNVFAEMVHWLLEQLLGDGLGRYSAPTHYLDDFFGASAAGEDGYWPVYVAYTLFEALGLQGNIEKSFWCKKELEVLGIVFNTIKQTASISNERKDRIGTLCKSLLKQKSVTLLDMQKVTGHLQFVTKIAPHGRAFMRRLYNMHSPLHRIFKRRLTREAQLELQFWIDLLETWDGVTLLKPQGKVIHLWTDASPRGLGAHLGPMDDVKGVWSKAVSRRHRQKNIRFLEALAVLDSLRAFQLQGLLLEGDTVVVHVDNENVQFGIASGSSRDPLLQTLLRALFTFGLEHHLTLEVVRVAGKENVLADLLSRRKFEQVHQHFPEAHRMLCKEEQSFQLNHQKALHNKSNFQSLQQRCFGMVLPSQQEEVLPLSVENLKNMSCSISNNNKHIQHRKSGSSASFVTARSQPMQQSQASASSSHGTSIWESVQEDLENNLIELLEGTNDTLDNNQHSMQNLSPCHSSFPSSKSYQRLSLPSMSQCIEQHSQLPLHASLDVEKSPTINLIPVFTSQLPVHNSTMEIALSPSHCPLVKQIPFEKESRLLHQEQMALNAQSLPLSHSSIVPQLSHSSNCVVPPISHGRNTSRRCTIASMHLVSHPRASQAIHFKEEQQQQQVQQVVQRRISSPLEDGRAIVMRDILTRQMISKHKLPKKPFMAHQSNSMSPIDTMHEGRSSSASGALPLRAHSLALLSRRSHRLAGQGSTIALATRAEL